MSGAIWFVVSAMAQPRPVEDLVGVDARLAAAEKAVHRELKAKGYGRVLRLGPRSWYLPLKLWKPGIMLHEEGFVRVRGRPILPLMVSRGDTSPKAVYGTFLVQPRGARRMQKAQLVQDLEPYLREIRDARWAMVRAEREAALREELAVLWFDGRLASGVTLADRRAIRQALFQ
ncbi:MAG: hypothetical protein AAF602_29330, partial [Myxococcota bacterium]